MGLLLTDIRHAWRSARARPGTAIGAVILIGAGIGLGTALFALADPFLWRPLPYDQPDQLLIVTIGTSLRDTVRSGTSAASARLPTLRDLQDLTGLFVSVAAYRQTGSVRVGGDNGSRFVHVAEVSPNFLRTLGGAAVEDLALDGSDAIASSIVLTHATAARLSDGQTLRRGVVLPRTSRGPLRVIAVLPPTFLFPSNSWIAPVAGMMPWGRNLPTGAPVDLDQLIVVARCQPGVTAGAVAAAIRSRWPAGARSVSTEAMTQYMTEHVRPLALGAVAAAILFFAVCCANVANLLLARTLCRRTEILARRALGAQNRDLVRLVLAEVGILVAVGVSLGCGFAAISVRLAGLVMPEEYLALGSPSVSWRAFVFSWVLGVTAMAIAFIPIGAVARLLSAGKNGTAATTRRPRLVRLGLTVGQTTLATILTIGAGLLTRSYVRLVGQDPGFSREPVAVSVAYPDELSGARVKADIDNTIGLLRRLPGVEGVGAATGSMLDRYIHFGGVEIRGESVSVTPKSVTVGFVRAIGTPVLDGRDLTGRDPAEILINRTLADRYWGTKSPVGESITDDGKPKTIVGVVGDSFDVSLDRPPEPTVYRLLEEPQACTPDCNRVTFVLSPGRPSGEWQARVRRAAASVDPDAVVVDVSSLGARLAGSVKNRSFATMVLTLFAVGSVAVCAVGLFALVAFSVARRTQEIAIRVALGAGRLHVINLAVGEVMLAMGIGIAAGALAGQWASLCLTRLLYQVAPGDLATLVWAISFMLLASIVGVLVPCARALRLSPALALRVE